ncbi:hypothetical protein R1sor_011724 [Riccia sorocarpa]|uniref:Nucleoside phosphorylase domain-containing protein n=1 Tax=Riccia sorocarpa TaxID=122646 RepID=A0ABD3I1P5_9MARC
MAPPALKGAPLPATPIKTVLLVVALQAEAAPLVKDLNLKEDTSGLFPAGVPWVKFSGEYKSMKVHLVTPGVDAIHGVDAVCTVPASLLTFSSVQLFKPDLIINCGTAGGFQKKGAEIGDVYLISETAFHDRRNMLPGFDNYGIGALAATPVPKLVSHLNLKVGVLTTGDSLDHVDKDDEVMENNNATVKDMEGAAIAYVADLLTTPLILLKGVTDIVDSPAATEEEFLLNLQSAAKAIQTTVTSALDFLSLKNLSDLQ